MNKREFDGLVKREQKLAGILMTVMIFAVIVYAGLWQLGVTETSSWLGRAFALSIFAFAFVVMCLVYFKYGRRIEKIYDIALEKYLEENTSA